MFDLKTTLNSIGILLTIFGVYYVYRNSPIHISGISGGRPDTDFDKLRLCTAEKNGRAKVGVYAVIVGSAFQLLSNYIATC